MRRLAVLLLCLCPAIAPAQSITVPEKIQIDQPGLVVIRATALDCDDARWFSMGPGLQTFPSDVVPPKPGVYLGFALTPGTYKIGVVPAKAIGGKAVIGQPVLVTVIVGGAPPVPPIPPIPPDPPKPAGLAAAIILYETADEAKLPGGQRQVLYSLKVRDYLNGKCKKGVDGKTAEARIWDKDTDGKFESPLLQSMLKVPRPSLPCVIVSDGSTHQAHALPADVDATLELLMKYGG